MATTKTTVAGTVKKPAKPAAKAATKPQQATAAKKATAHGLSLLVIGMLDAFGQRFILRACQYHESAGRVALDAKASAYMLTPKGVEAMASRPGLDVARERQAKGGKSAQGTPYAKAPSGFPAPYVFPFGKREEGTRDSQAAFAALMLAACGK